MNSNLHFILNFSINRIIFLDRHVLFGDERWEKIKCIEWSVSSGNALILIRVAVKLALYVLLTRLVMFVTAQRHGQLQLLVVCF